VDRELRDSRSESIKSLKERSRNPLHFPQVLMFPEGTTTNRSCLAKFKPGAFKPGVPVQPVLIRYPNRLDSCTWTWDGESAYKAIYYALAQFTNWMEVEFLPVYEPTEEEREDESLYCKNVETLMAKKLGVPNSDFQMEDGVSLHALSQTNLRLKLEKIWKIKGTLEMLAWTNVASFLREGVRGGEVEWDCNLARFVNTIFPHRSNRDPEVFQEINELFDLFKVDKSDLTIDLRAYGFLDLIMYASNESNFDSMVRLLFRSYVGRDGTTLSRESLQLLMRNIFEADEKATVRLYFGKQNTNVNTQTIAYEDFKKRIIRLVEFVKLYAMEITGQCSGNYPKRDARDKERVVTVDRRSIDSDSFPFFWGSEDKINKHPHSA